MKISEGYTSVHYPLDSQSTLESVTDSSVVGA
jgi:hypothetical protein